MGATFFGLAGKYNETAFLKRININEPGLYLVKYQLSFYSSASNYNDSKSTLEINLEDGNNLKESFVYGFNKSSCIKGQWLEYHNKIYINGSYLNVF